MTGASGSPAPKIQTSADSSEPDRASWQSCCSASSAHGTARTEAQRLGLIVLPPQTSKVTLRVRAERLRQPCSQNAKLCKELTSINLACKAVAQPHLPMALLAQSQKSLGLLACLATSKFQLVFRSQYRESPAVLLPKCERLQIARIHKSYPEKLLLSLICPWYCSNRGKETRVACLSCHLKLQT